MIHGLLVKTRGLFLAWSILSVILGMQASLYLLFFWFILLLSCYYTFLFLCIILLELLSYYVKTMNKIIYEGWRKYELFLTTRNAYFPIEEIPLFVLEHWWERGLHEGLYCGEGISFPYVV
jgi:hypothetical protein